MDFVQIRPEDLQFNPFEKIGKDWLLLTAGTAASYNTMTASWGGVGVLWGKNVLTCYVRDSRHTYSFMENNPLFTASFFDESQRDALRFCGSHSGRDCDKAKETGLTPTFLAGGMTFAQARQVYVCKTLYTLPLTLDGARDACVNACYEKDALHTMYIGEILGVYENKE